MTAPGFEHDSHGTLAEEAVKLAEALSKSWTDLSGSGFVHSLLSSVGESAECNVCPVCQLLRVAQGSRPEVFEHLAAASTSLLAALRAALESSQASWSAGSQGSAGTRPTSERIDIS
jgi:hypothetical protein